MIEDRIDALEILDTSDWGFSEKRLDAAAVLGVGLGTRCGVLPRRGGDAGEGVGLGARCRGSSSGRARRTYFRFT